MEFGDLSENPFARVSRKAKTSRRRAVVRAFQVFVLVSLATGGVLLLANQSKRWMIGRLTADFETLGATEKISRLKQLADLGVFSVEPLVNSMTDQDDSVARAGYELLRTAQNNWTVLPAEDEASRHELLIDSLKAVAIKLPDHRTGWGTSLLQQTLMFAAEHPDATGSLPERASNAINLLALSGRPTLSGATADLETAQAGRLAVQGAPLPVDDVQSVDQWTTWPPNQLVARELGEPSPVATSSADVDSVASFSLRSDQAGVPERTGIRSAYTPTVYKSGANRLQVVGENEVVQLAEVASSQEHLETGKPEAKGQESSIISQPVQRADLTSPNALEANALEANALEANAQVAMVDSPMGAFDDASVMRWLGSPHAALREKAKLELVSRGFDGTAIAIATRIYTGDVNEKIELVDALVGTSVIDPRPWLLLLLQDSDRDVRSRTISSLGSMDDPAITARLQSHLAQENDPAVASRIRRVLNLR
jgi:hypothetical protein